MILGSGVSVVALLEPDRGLQRRQIDTLTQHYGAHAEVFQAEHGKENVVQAADDFLKAVQSVAERGEPATVVVLGHGLPDTVQSYALRYDALAEAILLGAAARGQKSIDLSQMVFIFDCCYSANYVINLGNALEKQSQQRAIVLDSLPVMISGANRDRKGFVKVNELFVPRFWEAVNRLYYVNQPLPTQVTLENLFDGVDRYMYGYGRTPTVEGRHVVGYRTVDPDQVQDPVFFVPLKKDDIDDLRKRLEIPADVPIPSFLDIGANATSLPTVFA